MLVDKTAKVRWNSANKKFYEEKGYVYTKYGEEFNANIEDLPPTAVTSFKICCDICKGAEKTVSTESYTSRYNNQYLCKDCKDKINACVVCGKIDKYRGLYNEEYYCCKHLFHMKRYNRILERTVFDDNDFILHETHAEIFIYNRNGKIIESTFVSLDKLDLVKNYKWSLKTDKQYYKRAITNFKNNKTVSMHRLIMGLEEQNSDIFVDHINGNPLDNRNENLRICSCIENNRNHTKLFSTNTSGYTGVDFHKASGKWRARVKLNDKDIYLGIFQNIEDAITAREKAELKYYKEFSPHFNELKEKYKDYYNELLHIKN